ncbi:MAG TPA: hypothetical protein VML55_06805 [Planctomycetaceae bacterium]|nr:hypothetical protein [Planctomycetaceae bacterium]
MDTRQYQELLEDVRIDMAEAQRAVAEMRSLEAYIQRKLEAKGGSDGHYDELLSDVRRDVAGVDKDLVELRGVEGYLLRKLKGDRGGADSFPAARSSPGNPVMTGAATRSSAPTPLAPRATAVGAAAEPMAASEPVEPVVEIEPAGSGSSKPPAKKLMPLTKPAVARDKPQPRPAEKPKLRPSASEEMDANVTVEFGPDGFPMER